MTEMHPLSDVKARLSEMVDRVEETHERILVTRKGRPAAVLMSPDDLQALEETLDVLSDSGTLERLSQARADIAAGRIVTREELVGRYLRR